MEDFETIQTPFTSVLMARGADNSCSIHRHATKVFRRILHSTSESDQLLKERISTAMTVLSQTRSTETAILQTNRGDNLRRLASRVLRRMGTRS